MVFPLSEQISHILSKFVEHADGVVRGGYSLIGIGWGGTIVTAINQNASVLTFLVTALCSIFGALCAWWGVQLRKRKVELESRLVEAQLKHMDAVGERVLGGGSNVEDAGA